MRNLFRAAVPEETISKLLLCVGWKTLKDPQRAVLVPGLCAEAFTELWPYYWPVWAKKFLKDTPTLKEVITIIRQVLRQKNIQICAVERSCAPNKRKTFYYLNKPRGYVDYQPTISLAANSFSVSFN